MIFVAKPAVDQQPSLRSGRKCRRALPYPPSRLVEGSYDACNNDIYPMLRTSICIRNTVARVNPLVSDNCCLATRAYSRGTLHAKKKDDLAAPIYSSRKEEERIK
ncbi:unnamed protein product [Trichogramma brassicae]|uniref:Uncharacterized protein n=1 Tax=Trichogramma brassicae TaxID=86971 RepID=A0A6H5I5J5_9HYME|nr:unnamed protein product [Trichogramma brassicae]